MAEFTGTFTALVTPFLEGGSELDLESLDRLIDYQLDHGVAGLVACGSTGEAATLGREEYRRVLEHVKARVKGRAVCIAGIGVSSTAQAQELAALAKSLLYDGVLVSSPPYNKPPQEGLVSHFRAVKRSAGLPVIAYNIPGRTGVNIAPATLAALASEGTIAAVKESSGSMDQVMDILELTGRRLPILSGEDSLVLACMACGGKGVISASANLLPAGFSELTTAAEQGDWLRAADAQFKMLPTIRAMFMETNPIPVKQALALRGIINSPAVRLPLVAASAKTKDKLRELLEL